MPLITYEGYTVPHALRASPTMSAAAYGKKVAATGREVFFLTVGDLTVKPTAETLQRWQEQLARDAQAQPGEARFAHAAAKDVYKYADTLGAIGLRAAAAFAFARDTGIAGVDAAHVAVGTGAKGALNGVCAVLQPGDTVLAASPGWPTNFDMFPAGVRMIEVATEGRGLMSPAQLAEALQDYPQAKAVLINAPNNPTGANYSRDERTQLMQVLRAAVMEKDFLIILDDPYGKLVFDGQTLQRGADEAALFDAGKIAVLRSLSKEYGLAGARIGYVVSKRAEIIECVKRWNESKGGGISGPEQTLAQAALLYGEAFIAETIEDLKEKRTILMQAVEALRFARMEPPQGTIYGWVDFRALKGAQIPAGHTVSGEALTLESPQDLMTYLVEVAGVQGVGGVPFYAPGSPLAAQDWHVRLTFCGDKGELRKACEKLKAAEALLTAGQAAA
jgi:aspartate aminotransferase